MLGRIKARATPNSLSMEYFFPLTPPVLLCVLWTVAYGVPNVSATHCLSSTALTLRMGYTRIVSYTSRPTLHNPTTQRDSRMVLFGRERLEIK